MKASICAVILESVWGIGSPCCSWTGNRKGNKRNGQPYRNERGGCRVQIGVVSRHGHGKQEIGFWVSSWNLSGAGQLQDGWPSGVGRHSRPRTSRGPGNATLAGGGYVGRAGAQVGRSRGRSLGHELAGRFALEVGG